MKSISSAANAGFRQLRDLVGGSRERRGHGQAWIEGERLCQAFIESGQLAQVLVISDSQDRHAVVARHGEKAREVWELPARLFREISQLESSPGWGLVINEPSQALAQKPCDLVILDRVQDPGNLGSMLRSAAAAGITQAWCISGTVDPWSSKVLRSAMGAHFAIEIIAGLEEASAIAQVRALGIGFFSTANQAQAVSVFDQALALAQPCAWVFGQEGQGVSQTFQQASTCVAIPQSKKIDSLNVAAAASVCLFEMRRRRLSGQY